MKVRKSLMGSKFLSKKKSKNSSNLKTKKIKRTIVKD